MKLEQYEKAGELLVKINESKRRIKTLNRYSSDGIKEARLSTPNNCDLSINLSELEYLGIIKQLIDLENIKLKKSNKEFEEI